SSRATTTSRSPGSDWTAETTPVCCSTAHEPGCRAPPPQPGERLVTTPSTPHHAAPDGARPATTATPATPAAVRACAEVAARLVDSVGSVVLGKPAVVRQIVAALLAEGHVLLEEVPGVGTTNLALALAAVGGG